MTKYSAWMLEYLTFLIFMVLPTIMDRMLEHVFLGSRVPTYQNLSAGKQSKKKNCTGPIILLPLFNVLCFLNDPCPGRVMVRPGVVATPPERYETRQVNSHEDDWLQFKRAQTLLSCSVEMHYFVNVAIEIEIMPLLSMTKEVP